MLGLLVTVAAALAVALAYWLYVLPLRRRFYANTTNVVSSNNHDWSARSAHNSTTAMVPRLSTADSTQVPVPAAVLLYDGHCHLCDATVLWIVDHDPLARVKLCALQSRAGQALLEQYAPHLGARYSTSVVLLLFCCNIISNASDCDANTMASCCSNAADKESPAVSVLVESEAVLTALALLSSPVHALAVMCPLVPRPLRDAVYRAVAALRYRCFGRLDHCRAPREELMRHFIV